MSEEARWMQREVEALERVATALERFQQENEIQVEFGPPLCPNCGVFNPTVQLRESADVGKLGDYVIDVDCMECGNRIFGVVESYSMHSERSTALDEIKERAGGHGNGDSNTAT